MNNKKIHLIFTLIFLATLSIFFGSGTISWPGVNSEILWQIRLPRLLASLFVGLSLGFCGALLQILLQNPLAEPYTLGISGGASLGLCISLVFPIAPLWLSAPIFSGIGCILSAILVFYIANRLGKWNQKSILLAGILISFVCSSLTFVFFSILNPYDLQKAITWLIGSFGHNRDTWWPLQAIAFLIVFFICISQHKKIDYFLLGEDISQSFIKNKTHYRLWLLLAISILTAISVSICGLIAFLGLISPHISMMYLKSMRAKNLLIFSSVIGGILLVFSDLLTKWLYQWFYLPSGIFVALLGAPFMIYFLVKESSYVEA